MLGVFPLVGKIPREGQYAKLEQPLFNIVCVVL